MIQNGGNFKMSRKCLALAEWLTEGEKHALKMRGNNEEKASAKESLRQLQKKINTISRRVMFVSLRYCKLDLP